LDDFENACAAYEKSIHLSDDYTTRLNFAITLYRYDELEKSRIQFNKYEELLKIQLTKANQSDPNEDILSQADMLRKCLITTTNQQHK
jgi:hypothetical protein